MLVNMRHTETSDELVQLALLLALLPSMKNAFIRKPMAVKTRPHNEHMLRRTEPNPHPEPRVQHA
jgi:hypothetical protein